MICSSVCLLRFIVWPFVLGQTPIHFGLVQGRKLLRICRRMCEALSGRAIGGHQWDRTANHLICRVKTSKRLLGDQAHDSAELREETKPVIPNRSNRKQPFSLSKRLYKPRWRIKAAFNRWRDFTRIAPRNYLAYVCLAQLLHSQAVRRNKHHSCRYHSMFIASLQSSRKPASLAQSTTSSNSA